MAFVDIHGNRYDFKQTLYGTMLVGESGERAPEVIDVGTHLYAHHPDGTWRVAYVVTDQQVEETRALDAGR